MAKKSPYGSDYEDLPESQEITNPVSLLKLELGAKFCKITDKMETQEILELTGLHKADLSRIRVAAVERFSLDRLVNLLDALGYKAQVKVVKDREAS